MAEQEIGVVTHYFGHIEVAGIRMTDGSLKTGDTVHLLGHTTDFTQTVGSMQMEHGAVEQAKPGDEIGLKVIDHAREHDKVYKVL